MALWKLCLLRPIFFFLCDTSVFKFVKRFFYFTFSTCGSGIPPTQLSKYGNLGHVNIGLVQEPLAFLLPKRELVLCLDDKELAPELAAPAPAAEESDMEPAAAAHPEDAQEQADSAEAPPAEVPGADT